MKTHSIRLLLLGGVAMVVSVAAWTGSGKRSATVEGEGVTPRAEGLILEAGATQYYACELDSTVKMTHYARPNPEELTQELSGVLEFHVLETDEGGAWVGLRLMGAAYALSGRRDPGVDARLSTPFRAYIQTDGMPRELGFEAGLAAEHRALLEEMLRTFQLTLHDESGWMSEEQHGTGTYTARYTRRPDGRIERRKLFYAPSRMASGDVQVEVVAHRSEFLVQPDCNWVSEARVEEVLQSNLGSEIGVETRTSATLEWLPGHESVPDPGLWTRGPVEAAAVPTRIDEAERLRLRPEREQALLANLDGLDAATEQRNLWVKRLRELLLEDPELAEFLLRQMQRSDLQDRTRADLYLVFETAGTEEAQDALCRVVREPDWSEKDSLRALIALGGVEVPTETSLQALWETSQSALAPLDMANTAALALGSIAHHLRMTQESSYPDLREQLRKAVWAASTPKEKAIRLTSLGNTADPELSPEFVTFLEEPDPRVRTAAARALAKTGPGDVAHVLVQHIKSEPSSRVRASLAQALATWHEPTPDAMETVRGLVRKERDNMARLRMAQLLGQNLANHPENAGALRELVANGGSKDVIAYAVETLAAAGERRRD